MTGQRKRLVAGVDAAAQRLVDSVPAGAQFVAVADPYDPFTGLIDLRSIRMIASPRRMASSPSTPRCSTACSH